jgi:hypothetical protein
LYLPAGRSFHVCPFINKAYAKCADHLTFRNLSHAFAYCAGHYAACPIYRRLITEPARRQLAGSAAGFRVA